MNISSRRNARSLLLQSLYARIFVENFDRNVFIDTYQDVFGYNEFDEQYLQFFSDEIFSHKEKLLAIIIALAPKFQIETMPRIHIIILFIGLAEILYGKGFDIDERVSINEAIELAKNFSDET